MKVPVSIWCEKEQPNIFICITTSLAKRTECFQIQDIKITKKEFDRVFINPQTWHYLFLH